MKIIIFGPQGSGKGTQAELIARTHSLPYISTGDIFRYNIKNKTDLGSKVEAHISAGELVPDELTNEIVKDRLTQPDCEVGFVLDGYPRNKDQQNYLGSITAIDYAIVIEVSDEAAAQRLGDRLACKCGMSYHKKFNPPKHKGKCDKCGGELYKRDDDKPEAIKKRIEIYHQQTEPLYSFYNSQKVLYKVDGEKSIDEVYHQIDRVIHREKK